MKWFNKKNFALYMQDVKNVLASAHTSEDVLKMLSNLHVASGKIRKVSKDDARIGIIDTNDLVQEANKSLTEAWKKINWETVNESPDPEATLGNFLSVRIEGDLKRFINKAGSMMAVPESQIRKQKREQLEEIFDELKYSFKNFNWKFLFRLEDYAPGTTLRYDEIIADEVNLTPWETIRLNDELTTAMFSLSEIERRVLDMAFGLNYDRKWTAKEIAKELDMSGIGVHKAKHRALEKLNTDKNRILFKEWL